MTGPLIVCDTFELTMEHPIKSSRENDVNRNIIDSLGFTSYSDVMGRKYTYKLSWVGLARADYENLMDLYAHHLDSGIPITFTYTKWESSENGVDCNLVVSNMTPKGIRSEYFVGFDIELSEINGR
jgi:hypothetical protein